MDIFLRTITDNTFWVTVVALYKALAFIVSLAALFGIGVVVYKSTQLSQSPHAVIEGLESVLDKNEPPRHPKKIARSDWERITNTLEAAPHKDYVRAILEADALCDFVLRAFSYPGDTMGERMKALGEQGFAHIDAFWKVHKTRNDIAHGMGVAISPAEGESVLATYKKILEELEAI